MADVRVLVIRAAGINCDEEVMYAWQAAGARPTLLHINAVAGKPGLLDEYQIVTIPGGFSYGDDIAAGTILAQRILYDLAEPMHELVERGGGILGICNGFQVLVKAGLLPGSGPGPVCSRSGGADRAKVTVTFNDSAKFEARWVRMEICTDHCVFLSATESRSAGSEIRKPQSPMGPPRCLEMPVEHAEGKVVTASDAVTEQLAEQGRIALRYVDAEGRYDRYPANPNGSVAGIAGLCDSTGRILGLMPHPDRHFDHAHHPLWTRRRPAGPPDGLALFLSAVRYWEK